MKYSIFIVLFWTFTALGQTTDQQLAQHYYSNGEFDKAIVYYERLYENEYSKFNFTRYIECLEATGDIKTAEKLLKKAESRNHGDNEYSVMLARFYERNEEPAKADEIYQDLIENLTPSSREVVALYNLFKGQGKSELAYQTLVKGRKLLKKSYPLNFQFAEHYGSIGETQKMMQEYLDMIDYHASYLTSIQTVLASRIDFSEEDSEEYEILKKELIERTQQDPNDLTYAEMLTWLFIQRQNFAAALTHVIALDKRGERGGYEVLDFGNTCVENKDYTTARRAFQYVIDLGEKGLYFMRAQNALLNVNFIEVTTYRNFSNDELQNIIGDYKSVLERYGKKSATLSVMIELAHIEAFYANQAEEALSLLNEALELRGVTDMQKAELKMELADIHVLHGDVWEASLLYMQVDNDFKYETIGHEAKFKNARIFYYEGEFDYAQSQLDVLKQSTSKLIANDALKLSLFITDNYGMDSNYVAMSTFAHADLLIEQHQYQEAFRLFDSIIDKFPAHSLGDEIMYKKAHAMQLKGKWNEAITFLEELLKYYPEDILADDALFELGNIYQNHLMNPKKSMEYYRKILFEHKGSLYSAETRKRYQELRKQFPESESEKSL